LTISFPVPLGYRFKSAHSCCTRKVLKFHSAVFPLGPSALRLTVVTAGQVYDVEFSKVTDADTPTPAPSSEEYETFPPIVLLILLSIVVLHSELSGKLFDIEFYQKFRPRIRLG